MDFAIPIKFRQHLKHIFLYFVPLRSWRSFLYYSHFVPISALFGIIQLLAFAMINKRIHTALHPHIISGITLLESSIIAPSRHITMLIANFTFNFLLWFISIKVSPSSAEFRQVPRATTFRSLIYNYFIQEAILID